MTDYSLKRAGNYTLSRKLGDGGFATVYLAQHTVLEKKAAVKLLLEEWVEEPDVVSRFFDEARTMESVHDHPNIVKIIDIATMEKCKEEGLPPYFIMEYLEGKSLDEIMRGQGFTLEEIVQIMDSALSALQYCHNHGVVHRDIKPSNFMLDGEGKVKLTDFGIAKAVQNTSKTGEGLTLGSTDYMSPEQALGKRDLDYRSDIYSLGVTLYQLVCDRLPFIAESANAVALKHIQEKPVAPIVLNPDVPKRLNNIILKAMEKEREHRFQSCDEMREELNKLLDPNIPDEELRPSSIPSDDSKTAARTASRSSASTVTMDISSLRPNPEDDLYSGDDYDPTTNYTNVTSLKIGSRKPPTGLVNFLRIILIVGVATLAFLVVFYLYNKFTQTHFEFEASPMGAKIMMNETLIGTAPLNISLGSMRYLVSLEMDGYESEKRLIEPQPGKNIKIAVNLRREDKETIDLLNKTSESISKKYKVYENMKSKTKKEIAERERVEKQIDEELTVIQKKFEDHVKDYKYGIIYVEICHEIGRIKEAQALIAKYLEAYPESSDLHCLMSKVQLYQGKKETARDSLFKAYQRNPNSKYALNSFAQYFLDVGEKNNAIQYYEMSLFLYPNQPSISAKLNKLK